MTENDAAFDNYLTAMTSGVVVLRGFLGRKAHEFEAMAPDEANARILAAGFLYGKTRYTMQQRKTLEAAVASELSVSVLAMIAVHAKKIQNERNQWVLWRELTKKKRPAAVINKIALERVRELKDTKEKRTVSLRTSRGADGMGTLTFTAPQAEIADIKHSLESPAGQLMKTDEDLTKPQAHGEAFADLLKTGGGVARSAYLGITAVPIADHDQYVRGKGGDKQIICDDGTVLTPKEYLERTLADMGMIVLVDEMDGAVEAFYTSRTANAKQRIMGFVENPTCVAPNCTVPFAECEMHHVVAWKNGGPTNMNNLVPLCKYHNGKNDDDWWRKLNGHIEKRGPFAYWVSAYGFPDRRNEHRLAKLGAARKLFG